MSLKCLFGHQWEGCVCSRCQAKRDEGHDWDGCKCRRCSKERDEGHDWDGCVCKHCGKRHDYIFLNEESDESHKKYRCRRCGHMVVEELVECGPCYGEGEILYFASESGMGGGCGQTCYQCGGSGKIWETHEVLPETENQKLNDKE